MYFNFLILVTALITFLLFSSNSIIIEIFSILYFFERVSSSKELSNCAWMFWLNRSMNIACLKVTRIRYFCIRLSEINGNYFSRKNGFYRVANGKFSNECESFLIFVLYIFCWRTRGKFGRQPRSNQAERERVLKSKYSSDIHVDKSFARQLIRTPGWVFFFRHDQTFQPVGKHVRIYLHDWSRDIVNWDHSLEFR